MLTKTEAKAGPGRDENGGRYGKFEQRGFYGKWHSGFSVDVLESLELSWKGILREETVFMLQAALFPTQTLFPTQHN